jgi:hypothetical protein
MEDSMNRTLAKCPVCEGDLTVTELSCPSCKTSVRGEFRRCRMCSAPDEHIQFVEAFLRNRGNLTNVGIELGLSSPTVSRRLDAALRAMGLREDSENRAVVTQRRPASDVARRRILEALDAGEIDAEEATRRLQDMQPACSAERSL